MITSDQRKKILDILGEVVIKEVRDVQLKSAIRILNKESNNKILSEKFKDLSKLEPKEVYALECLFERVIDSTLFEFMQLFESQSNSLKLTIKANDTEYDFYEISEIAGSELSSYEDDGWIAKYSNIGRLDNELTNRITAPIDWHQQDHRVKDKKSLFSKLFSKK